MSLAAGYVPGNGSRTVIVDSSGEAEFTETKAEALASHSRAGYE